MPSPISWSESIYATLGGEPRVDALLSGIQWASGALSFSFPQQDAAWSTDPDTGYGPSSGDGEPWAAGYQGLFDTEQAAARLALAAWAAVANLDFTEVADTATEVGDIRLAYVAGTIAQGAQAFAYYPGDAAWGGDVWFNVDGSSFTDPWEGGSYEFMTVLHELGHALGLKHPFEQETLNPRVLSAALDSRSYTLMSYSAAPGDAGTVFSFEPTTPMLLDIAAVQLLYGANYTWNTGDTEYRFDGGSFYHQTIWDAGGVDTIVLDGTEPGRIDLREGLYGSRVAAPVFAEDGFGRPATRVNNVWIALGTVIENATGGAGADRIGGNAVRNVLRGGAGNDWLDGALGADRLWGGIGRDRLDGGADNDRLSGGAGNDILDGGGGADRFAFDSAPGAHNNDLVLDFTPGSDRLLLDRGVFPALPAGAALDSAVLQSGPGVTSALDADDRLLYDSATGALYYDPDGTGDAAALPFAQFGVTVHPVLSTTDFAVIR